MISGQWFQRKDQRIRKNYPKLGIAPYFNKLGSGPGPPKKHPQKL